MTDKEEIEYLRHRLLVNLNQNRVRAAIAAMQGMLASPIFLAAPVTIEQICKEAILYADELLKQLSF